MEKGAVVPFDTVVELGRRWYSGRLDRGWRGRSVDEKRLMLQAVGLEGPFWELPGG